MEINIYKKARETAKMTQEYLAGEMDLSVTSIKAYESGETKPTIDKVIKMCDIYGNDILYYEHLQKEDLLGLLPKRRGVGIQGGTLELVSCLENIHEKTPALIEIVKDGKIDNHEAKEYKEILTTMTEIFKPIIELIYAVH